MSMGVKKRLTPGQLLASRSRLGRDPAAAGEGWRALSALYTEIAARRTQRLSTACVIAPDATGGLAPGLWNLLDDCIRLDGNYLPEAPDELNPADNFDHHKALSAMHGVFSHECGHAVHSLHEMPDEKLPRAVLDAMSLLEEIRMEAHTVAERPSDAPFMRAAAKHIILEDQKFILSAMTRVSACASAATLIEGRVLAGTLQQSDAAPITQIADALIPEPTRSDLRQLWRDVIAIDDDDMAGMEQAARRFLDLLPEEAQVGMTIIVCDCDCHKQGQQGKGASGGEQGNKDSEGSSGGQKGSHDGCGCQSNACDCDCHKKEKGASGEKTGRQAGDAAEGEDREQKDSKEHKQTDGKAPDLDGPIPPPAPEQEDGPQGGPACGANRSKVSGGQGRCDAEEGPENNNSGASGSGGSNGPTDDDSGEPKVGAAGAPGGQGSGQPSGEAQNESDKSSEGQSDSDKSPDSAQSDSGCCPDCGCPTQSKDKATLVVPTVAAPDRDRIRGRVRVMVRVRDRAA